jgi:hypothetical protein
MSFNLTLRKVYLYLFAIIGLILVIIGAVSFVNLGLKKYVFTKADYPCYHNSAVVYDKNGQAKVLTAEEQQAENDRQKAECEEQRGADKQRQAANALAQLIIGLPLYLYHWTVIKKENQV